MTVFSKQTINNEKSLFQTLTPFSFVISFCCKIFIVCTSTLFAAGYLTCHIKVTRFVDCTMIADKKNVSQESLSFRSPSCQYFSPFPFMFLNLSWFSPGCKYAKSIPIFGFIKYHNHIANKTESFHMCKLK